MQFNKQWLNNKSSATIAKAIVAGGPKAMVAGPRGGAMIAEDRDEISSRSKKKRQQQQAKDETTQKAAFAQKARKG